MSSPAAPEIRIAEDVIAFVLSSVGLTAISIIVSGKLIARRLPLGLRGEDRFRIPLIILDIQARGDEVSLGLTSFIMSLCVCIGFGGKAAYELFRTRSGIDVGQWNSLCVIASFLSVIVAALICAGAPLLTRQPLISNRDRQEMLERLETGRSIDEQ